MDQFFILVLTAATSAGAYLFGVRKLGFPAFVRRGIGRMLETIGVAVLFFGANLLLTFVIVLGLRAVGIFVSLNLGADPTLIGMSLLQGVVFQFWRYSGAMTQRQ